MDGFINLAYVLSFAGMVGTTVLVTQFIKKLIPKIKPEYIALAVSIILAATAAVFFGSFTTGKEIAEQIITWAINAVIVWFSAMKAYETAQSPVPPDEG